jgi:fermentation-respiration switch protein FrsA (DUF1100 family)
MPVTIPTERVDFSSRGTRCAAWLTLPAGPAPHPAVVLAHGLGATDDMMLAQYEQHFAAAGIATLAFDYRNTGASDGRSRQHISTREQCVDVAAALEFLKSRPEVDGGRIGLWGTSLGGMNVIRVAAARDDVAVAVVQCPIGQVDAPLLVCVCDRENLMDPAYAALVAHRAPRGVATHYDSDHFAIYHPPLVTGVLADQTAFLQEHFGVDA